MAFRPLQYDSGKLVKLPASNGGSSQAYAKGDAITFASGYAAPAAGAQGGDVTHVAMEDKTVTANGTELLCLRVAGVVFEADCDAAWSIVDRGTYCDLATVATLDPDASADDLFFIEEGVGAAESGTKVIGWFVHGAPNA